VSRLGGLAVYDTDLDITWIADADLLSKNSFGLARDTNLGPNSSDSGNTNGFIYDTRANWAGALHWIDAMNAADYLGFNDWRLPDATIPDPSCTSDQAGTTLSGDSTGFNCTGGEFGHLHYSELGVSAGSFTGSSLDPSVRLFDVAGNPDVSSFIGFPYWTNTEAGVGLAMYFNPSNGEQVANNKTNDRYVIAVRNGDVGVVPIPPAIYLLGSGLIGLLAMAHRKTA